MVGRIPNMSGPGGADDAPGAGTEETGLDAQSSLSQRCCSRAHSRAAHLRQEHGWHRLRLLSSAANAYNRDNHGRTAEGSQRPMLNVFHWDERTIRHFWASELLYAPTDGDQDPRHVGTIEPLWNLFDLTPEGRPPDWYEQLSY